MNSEQAQRIDKPAADVTVQRVAHVYAEALLNAAERQGQADDVHAELRSLVDDVFDRDGQLESFLGSGAIGRHRKADVLEKVFASRANELFFNFLMVLNDHERLELIRSILTCFKGLRDQRAKRINVLVQSAAPLEQDQSDKLRADISEIFQLEPIIEAQVEPELLGGMVVRVGDWLYDGSVKTRIKQIRDHLMVSSAHEIQSRRDRFSSTDGN